MTKRKREKFHHIRNDLNAKRQLRSAQLTCTGYKIFSATTSESFATMSTAKLLWSFQRKLYTSLSLAISTSQWTRVPVRSFFARRRRRRLFFCPMWRRANLFKRWQPCVTQPKNKYYKLNRYDPMLIGSSTRHTHAPTMSSHLRCDEQQITVSFEFVSVAI